MGGAVNRNGVAMRKYRDGTRYHPLKAVPVVTIQPEDQCRYPAPTAVAPYIIDCTGLVPGAIQGQNVDEVYVDCRDLPPEVTTVTALLPETEGADITAVIQAPIGHHQPFVVFATPGSFGAQTAIKVYNETFNQAISIAGGLRFGGVAALLYKVDTRGTIYSDNYGMDSLWSGSQLFITASGEEYGILHTPKTNDIVDDIADVAAVGLGHAPDADLVTLIKDCLGEYLDNGNYPMNVNFAAEKAGLAIQSLVLLILRLHSTADPV